MVADGLLALVCAGMVVSAGPAPATAPAPGENQDTAVATTLAVQTAMQQGREHLLHGEYRAAVATLESQLPYINGNRAYLRLLEDAYRRYIQELRLNKQDAEAQRYLKRLIILDRGAVLDNPITGSIYVPPASPTPVVKTAPPAPAKPVTVRLKSEDDDPFLEKNALSKSDSRARQLLRRAEEEFGSRHYGEARLLYEQAHDADPSVTASCGARWAYCKLDHVVNELNGSKIAASDWSELEHEVEAALKLAPKLEYGNYLLTEIQKRRNLLANETGTLAANRSSPGLDARKVGEDTRRDPPVPVRHSASTSDGWLLAETANFRIFHNQSKEFVERVAQVAEQTRTRLQLKWFGSSNETWSPKCDLFLHATAQDYSRATGQYNSPGHSLLKMENGRLVVRRIDLHCDEANLLTAILPHETTHVVLAGEFGARLLPRWADEGMAVLTEPRERIDRHFNNLLKCRQTGQLLHLHDLVLLEDYPKDPHAISGFYAQSVALVEFLTNQRGPLTFTQFLHDGMRYGFEKALQRNYGYRSFADLEQRWGQHAFHEGGSLAEIAELGGSTNRR
jgi:tetratricopeptide (TPR) repeat protein